MRAGEQRAFDEFFAACASRLAAYAARRTALDRSDLEDIVQNTLVKALRNLGSYRGEAALLTWVTEICRHELADMHRKTARRPVHESLDASDATADGALSPRIADHREPPGELAAAQRRAAVMSVLEALPRQYALALEAKYGDDLSVNDVAALLGVTPTAAQSLLARAREAFRQQWNSRRGTPAMEHPGHDG